MPWYEYICEKCGKVARRKRPIAHRDSVGKHVDEDGCGDGELKRTAAISRPPDEAGDTP